MLFWLKKAVAYWLMPLPMSLALMVVGLLLLRSKRGPRAGRILLVTGIVLLAVMSNKQVGIALIRPLERQYAAVPELVPGGTVPADLAGCRVIVVLGGGHVDAPGLPATERLSNSATARIVEGVRLARALPHATLLVSGPSAGRGATHASVLAAAAVALGVAPERISQIDTARDTDDEAQQIKRRVGPGVRFALVTSAWHMPRAMHLMRRAGLEPVACPTDFLGRTNPDTRFTDWLCDVSGLERSTWAIYERLGLAWARLQGK